MRFLLAPGIGDNHWILLKLRNWIRRRFPGRVGEPIDLYCYSSDRSIELLERVPWVRRTALWVPRTPAEDRQAKEVFDALVSSKLQDYQAPFLDFDAFVVPNGRLIQGEPWASVLNGAAADFDYGLHIAKDDLLLGLAEAERGPFALLFFVDLKRFSCWSAAREQAQREFIKALPKRFPGVRFLLTGREWDLPYTTTLELPPEVEDRVGQTSLGSLFGLMRHASAHFGWCAGNGILAQFLGCPTVMVWSRQFYPTHDRGVGTWERPGVFHKVLEIEDAKTETWLGAMEQALRPLTTEEDHR